MWLYGNRILDERVRAICEAQPSEMNRLLRLNVGDIIYLARRPKNPEAGLPDMMAG